MLINVLNNLLMVFKLRIFLRKQSFGEKSLQETYRIHALKSYLV